MKKLLKKDWFFPLLFNLVVWAGFLLIFTPAEKTDDYVMKCILDGAFSGQPDAHLIYCNYLFGTVLCGLQTAFPAVAWFELSQHILIFLSLTALAWATLPRENRWLTTFSTCSLILFFGYKGYIKLTFSKTAGIAIGVGLYLLFSGLFRKTAKSSVKHMVIGAVLTLLGSLYRNKLFYSGLVLLAGILLPQIISWFKARKTPEGKLLFRRIILAIVCMAGLTITVKLSYIGGRSLYCRDSAWNDYRDYNTRKVELQDYGWPDYDTYSAEYAALGISRNDYDMWNARDYSDPNILTIDLMDSVIELKEPVGIKEYISTLPEYLKEYPLRFLTKNAFIFVLAMSLILLLSDRKYKWISVAYSFLALTLLEYYLYCNGRYSKNHIDLVLCFSACLVLLFEIKEAQPKSLPKEKVGMAACLIFIFVITKNLSEMETDTYDGSTDSISQEDAREVMDELSSRKDNLYIFSNAENDGLLRSYGAFESHDAGVWNNIFVLSTYSYPSHRAVLEDRGIENVYEALLYDDNVYYVSSDGYSGVNRIEIYLQEHYNVNAAYEEVEEIGDVMIFDFTVGAAEE